MQGGRIARWGSCSLLLGYLFPPYIPNKTCLYSSHAGVNETVTFDSPLRWKLNRYYCRYFILKELRKAWTTPTFSRRDSYCLLHRCGLPSTSKINKWSHTVVENTPWRGELCMQVSCVDEDRKLPLLEWEFVCVSIRSQYRNTTWCLWKRLPFLKLFSELEKPHLTKSPINLVRQVSSNIKCIFNTNWNSVVLFLQFMIFLFISHWKIKTIF